jgi:hypothetical protein
MNHSFNCNKQEKIKMPLNEDKENNHHILSPAKGSITLSSNCIPGQLTHLTNLLRSSDQAENLFQNITINVNDLRNKLFHLQVAINLFKYHESKPTHNLKLLSTFQKTLIEYFESSTINEALLNKEKGITKKIYLFLYSDNYFVEDQQSNDFNIFDYCSMSQSDVINQLYDSLELHCCNEKILHATKLFLLSKKVIKNYLRVYVNAFHEISKKDKSWPESIIGQGLMSFRDNYTEDYSMTTKYHEVSRAFELFQHLKSIGLLGQHLRLPDNIEKPSKTSLMRNTNPTIASFNIDKINKEKSLTSAKTLIDEFYSDLVNKLDQLIEIARNTVFDYYKKHYPSLKDKDKKKNIGLDNDLATAMHIIITDEEGINPTSLYNLKVTSDKKSGKSKNEFIKIEDDGTVRFNVIKWRQRRLQKRTTETASLSSPADISSSEINSSFCIQFAIELTEYKRKKLKTNLLWVTKSQHVLRKNNTFDHIFRKFCDDNLPAEFSTLKPTLMRVRTSRAIEIYIREKGNVIAVATYLGNRVKTTLSTYIPQFLQEIMYRRKISVFQNIYLILATATEPEKLKSLGLSQEDYDKCIVEIYKNKDFGGPLFEKLKPSKERNHESKSEYFFICSPDNFAFTISFLKKAKNDNSEFYNVCLNALNKASSGSTQQKIMIRDAELILKNKGNNYE